MRGDIAMHDAPCPGLHQEKHLESSEPSAHHGKEIGGYDGLGVIVDKRLPVLRRGPSVTSSLRFGRPIGAHCTWRNMTPAHVKPPNAAARLFREPPNAEGNRQPDYDHVHQQT